MKKKRQRKYAAILFGLLFSLAMGGKAGQEPMMIGYQGKFNTSGWSGSGNAHAPCLQGEGYLTGMRFQLMNRPDETEGGIEFQVNAGGLGWIDGKSSEPGTMAGQEAQPEKEAASGQEPQPEEEAVYGQEPQPEPGAAAEEEAQPDAAALGEEPPLEAVRIWLTGGLETEYDLYYRVYQNGGWLPWSSNGQEAGGVGQGFWINGIQALIQRKGLEPPEDEEEEEEALPQVDPSRPMIALTFDDGPRASVTDRILAYLRESGGRATFFMVGNRVAANENSVNQMVAQGCQVGNHTFDHQYITRLSLEEMQQQIGGTNQAVLDACGILPMVIRPPGGKVDEASLTILETMGMPAVMWSIDTRDWQHRDAQMTVEAVLSQVKDGDIVLMHDIYPSTADAAAVVIPALTERGYQLVTVSELAMYRGGMLPGHKYSRFSPVQAVQE